MTIQSYKTNRWQVGMARMLGAALLAGICAATVGLLGVLAIYFLPMYLIAYLQFLQRPNRFSFGASAVLIVLAVLSRI